MKLAGFLQQRDELSKGNLRRCLENLARYCDDIVVFDDGSTDDSVAVARDYTDYVIEAPHEGLARETEHRQQLLELALSLDPDYVFWLDADECLDRLGTTGGLRALCEDALLIPSGSYEFEEVTLWRSQSWRRLDYLGRGFFKRLWYVGGQNTFSLAPPSSSAPMVGMVLDLAPTERAHGTATPVYATPRPHIPKAHGLHKQLYPENVGPWKRAPFRILHYGYATQEAIERRWRERTGYGVPTDFRRQGLDERNMVLERVPREWFPEGCEPPEDETKPEPIRFAEDCMREAGL